MKNYIYTSLLVFLLGLTGFSQNLTKPGDNNILNEKMEFGNFTAMQFPIINIQKPKVESEMPLGNQIFIEQVGSENAAISNVSSKISSINFYQEGRGNYISINAKVNSIVEKIIQDGERNNIFDNVYAPDSNISLILTQNGSNHHFERYGANSIGDKLEFNMKGNDKSIIVRNFK